MHDTTPFWSPETRFWIGEPEKAQSISIPELIRASVPGALNRMQDIADGDSGVVVVAESSSVPRLIAGAMVSWLAGHIPLPLWRQNAATVAQAIREQQAVALFSDGIVMPGAGSAGPVADGVDYILPSSGTTRGDVRWIGGTAPRVTVSEYAAAPKAGDRVLVDAAPDGLGFATLVETLASGGEYLCLAPFDTERWFYAVETFRPTFVRTVPIHMDWIRTSQRFEAATLDSIRVLHHSGSRLRESVRAAWSDRIGAVHLIETYACKEGLHTTMIAGDEWLSHPGSVGRVARGTIRLLTADGGVVSTGAGEIVAQRLDPRRKVPLESVTDDGRTFYRTGDMGTIDDDGYLFVNARIGDEERVNGVWVDLNRIAAEIQGFQGIRDCFARVASTAGGTEHLVVEVEAVDGADTDALRAAIRDHCRALRIVHSINVQNAPLPRDASGKIRRSTMRFAETA
ncbi:AMP-binding protein [Leifsonia aquatica]|uniref:AMP-binding protein n=1 Tax=Leifsonia aquatica TaxID=144185 RepID=UPI00385018B8